MNKSYHTPDSTWEHSGQEEGQHRKQAMMSRFVHLNSRKFKKSPTANGELAFLEDVRFLATNSLGPTNMEYFKSCFVRRLIYKLHENKAMLFLPFADIQVRIILHT